MANKRAQTWKEAAKAIPSPLGPATVPAAPLPGVETDYRTTAPWPQTDRFPVVLGSNLNLTVISAHMRSATMGYRQQWVDVLDELLEREPTGFANLSQRILITAGARITVRPCSTPKGSPEETLALENAELVQTALDRIVGRTAAFAELLWAIYYGIVGQEIMWAQTPLGLLPESLQFIHSRRLAYPDFTCWDLHVWDQGAVSTQLPGTYPSERLYGLRVQDYPHKFIIHVPHVRGDYPTRDGLGRELALWFALKGMAARVGAQFIERFAKPWAFAYYATTTEGWDRPRDATGTSGGAGSGQSDIEIADAAMKALGTGSLSGAALPNSVKVVLEQVKYGMTPADFIALINKEISKAILTTSDISEGSVNGSRAATSTRKEGVMEVTRFDAANFGDTLRRDLATPVILLNRPHAAHLIPIIDCAVEEKPAPMAIWEVIGKAVLAHAPVDADWAAEQTGLKLVPNLETGPDGQPVPRMLYPAKPVEEPPFAPPRDPTPEEEAVQEAADEAAAVQAAAGVPQAPQGAHGPARMRDVVSNPEAPTDAPFGEYAWASRRDGLPDEPDTEIERIVFAELRKHFASTNRQGLTKPTNELLRELVRRGWYKTVLHPPDQALLFRGLTFRSREEVAHALECSLDAVNDGEEVCLNRPIPIRNGWSTSWTSKRNVASEFSDDRRWAVTLVAEVARNDFLEGPNGLYDVRGMSRWHLEKESVGLEPIIVLRAEVEFVEPSPETAKQPQE